MAREAERTSVLGWLVDLALLGGAVFLALVVTVVVAQADLDVQPSLGCEPDAFESARALLGPRGRLEVDTSTVGGRLSAYVEGRRVWTTPVRSRDCELLGQIADIGVERALRQPSTSGAVGDVPSLGTADPSRAEPKWHLEFGAGALLELAEVRGGGAVDLFLERRGLGGRLEIGAFGPRGGGVRDGGTEIGTLEWFSVHGMVGLDGCLAARWLPRTLRPCAGLAGGIEWISASAAGDLLFRTEARSRVLGRVDGTLRLGWAPGPAGLEGWIRGTWRPDRPIFAVEGAQVDGGVPLWTASMGIRGWLRIF